MDSSDFGPVYECEGCGAMVQSVRRWKQWRIEQMSDGGRHHCRVKGERLPRYCECTCGAAVMERYGEYFDLTGKPHVHAAPPPPATPAPKLRVEKPKYLPKPKPPFATGL